MLPTVTGERQINSAARALVARVERVIALAAVRAPRTARVEAQALATDPAAELELEIDLVAEEEPALGLAEAVLERDQVEAELALVPVAAELVLAQAVVLAKIKSATAAHRLDLPLLTAEDSAGVAVETSRARAAIEEVTAWAAAVSAVAVAAEAAAAAAEAEAEEEDVVDEQIR
jgi:hypothetical protein